VICNFNSNSNSVNDLLSFVEPNSEYISAARGFFEHFPYNRMARTHLMAQGYSSCASLVKIGARDFGNGNYYGDYFIQVAYSKPMAKSPDFILSALYRAGSVQSFEGTSTKPWYMLDAKDVLLQFQDLRAHLIFSTAGVTGKSFDPVKLVKDFNFSNGEGVTYTPLYDNTTADKFFLVTWAAEITHVKVYQAVVLKVAQGIVSVAPIQNMTDQIYIGLSSVLTHSDPRAVGVEAPDDLSLSKIVLQLSSI
jgi:hypothetical protein